MAELAEHVINTKVTESAKKRLEAICQQYDFTLYDMLQMLCDCLIRYMDDFHNLDENLIRIIRMFEGLPGWKNALRLTEDMSDAQVMEAF
jgi:replication initiation and membrane attachment protein DnaB